jgi:diacylglycerol O-acyltransferase / wax synthase
MARTPLSSVDAAWLGMEDPTNLMMVTGVMALEGHIDMKRLRLVLERKLAPFSRFHQRVVRPRSRANLPHWEDDPTFDVDNHVTHIGLAAPADETALRRLVSELMSEPLDYTKPLWHMHVIDGYEGGSVILTRIHHAIADGIALVRVLLSLTESEAGWKTPARPRPRPSQGLRLSLDWLPAAVRRGVSAGQQLAARPDRVIDIARIGVHGAYRLGRLVVLPPDPPTVFKGPLGRRKRAAWSDPLPLDDFKAIGRAFGATVNDVLVATATGALRRYMERRGQETTGVAVRASVPVNLRAADRAHELGNAFGLVFLKLPVGIADPARRLRAIKKEMDELKRSPEALVAFGVLSLMGLAPVEVEQVGLRFFGSKATAVLTNVPGPRVPLYFAGRKIDRVMFWVPQSGHLGLGISIISYAGGVMLGVASDARLVPDPERIVDLFKVEFEAMRAAAAKRSGARRPATRRRQATAR